MITALWAVVDQTKFKFSSFFILSVDRRPWTVCVQSCSPSVTPLRTLRAEGTGDETVLGYYTSFLNHKQ